MPGHTHIHRRHARAAFPDPLAWASAVADAFPNPFAEPKADADPAQTLVSVVYVTASKTFDGPVGGYTTLGPVKDTPTANPKPTPASTKAPKVESTPTKNADSTSAKKTSAKASQQTTLQTSALPSSIGPPTADVESSIPIAVASTSITYPTKSSNANQLAATSSPTSTAEKSQGGMSAGGKAGLAIGILLLFGTVLAVVLFCFKKRKDAAKKERLDDEKTQMFAGAGRTASTRTTATAPRLSLRPLTEFLPNLGEKRQSRGNALANTHAQPQSLWERPMGGQEAARNNPFGNHAEVIDAANASGPPVVNDIGPGGEIVATGAAVGLARGASKHVPNAMNFTKDPFKGPPSPSGTEFSVTSTNGTPVQTGGAAAIAAAGGPANSAVHRVQLDFKPSLEDELELKAGSLVRLLHEYDDGWALCIRLDRSRQGVVPRTCLSTRPVKPRPQQGGPRGQPPPGMRVPGQPRPMSPGMNRPMSPAMNQGRPMSPAMNQGPRPMSPAGNRPMTPQGRPMTSNGPKYNPQRPMTPNSQNRSPSTAQMQDRRNSPPGPSPMNPAVKVGSPPNPSGPVTRKPVGQAM